MKHQTRITVYRSGKLAANVQVSLEYSGLSQMGFAGPSYTNRDGVAIVEHASTGPATLWVNSSARGSINTPGSDVVHL